MGAHNDAYVSTQSIRELAAHWPGAQVRMHACMLPSATCNPLADARTNPLVHKRSCSGFAIPSVLPARFPVQDSHAPMQVRWVPGGHVSAFVLQQPAFRAAIADSLARLLDPRAEDADAA